MYFLASKTMQREYLAVYNPHQPPASPLINPPILNKNVNDNNHNPRPATCASLAVPNRLTPTTNPPRPPDANINTAQTIGYLSTTYL